MWRLLLGTMVVKSLVQGLNAAATAGFEPRTVWSEVRRRNRLATISTKGGGIFRNEIHLPFPLFAGDQDPTPILEIARKFFHLPSLIGLVRKIYSKKSCVRTDKTMINPPPPPLQHGKILLSWKISLNGTSLDMSLEEPGIIPHWSNHVGCLLVVLVSRSTELQRQAQQIKPDDYLNTRCFDFMQPAESTTCGCTVLHLSSGKYT